MDPDVLCRKKADKLNHSLTHVGGDGEFSKVVATFNHVGGSFDLFMATTGNVWKIPSFQI